MHISPNDNFPVEIILPKRWYRQARYRITKEVVVDNVRVPAGFVSDGATVPLLLRWAFPPLGRYFPAALVHDFLLVQGESWGHSNRVFRSILPHCNIPTWQRVLMGWATSLYGTIKESIKAAKTSGWFV